MRDATKRNDISSTAPTLADEPNPKLVSGAANAGPGMPASSPKILKPCVESAGRNQKPRARPKKISMPLGLQGQVIELTVPKQSERALKSSEERYRTLFNAMDEAFCDIEIIYDANGKATDYRFIEVTLSRVKKIG